MKSIFLVNFIISHLNVKIVWLSKIWLNKIYYNISAFTVLSLQYVLFLLFFY